MKQQEGRKALRSALDDVRRAKPSADIPFVIGNRPHGFTSSNLAKQRLAGFVAKRRKTGEPPQFQSILRAERQLARTLVNSASAEPEASSSDNRVCVPILYQSSTRVYETVWQVVVNWSNTVARNREGTSLERSGGESFKTDPTQSVLTRGKRGASTTVETFPVGANNRFAATPVVVGPSAISSAGH